MSKQKNFVKTYLFSTVGVFVILIVLVALNILCQRVRQLRIDLTEDRLYSLSEGTRRILGKLDTKVTLRFYRSSKGNSMPVWLRSYANRVEDLLREYVEVSHGKIILQKYDPTPDSDAEDSASLDGISGQKLPNGGRFYLGLAVNCLDSTVSIPFISPMEEGKLEYNITRSIYEAIQGPAKSKIGLISSLPIMGGNIQAYMARNRRPKPPWIFMQELKRNFTVEDLGTAVEKIPDGLDLLMVIHPKKLSRKTVFAIDQYLLKGGKLLLALDPYCLTGARNNPQAMMGQMVMPGSSSIPELLKNWGVIFPIDIVADLDYAMRSMQQGNEVFYPTVLDLRNFDAQDDIVIGSVNHLNMIYTGEFAGDPAAGLTKTVMLSSSPKSQMIKSFMAQADGAQLMKNFSSDHRKKALIIRLNGKFKTAFPDGPPPEEKKDGDPNKESPETNVGFLQTGQQESTVVLLADVDMLADEFLVSKQKIFGRDFIQPINDNLNLIQSLVEFLSGDDDLISIRMKRIRNRPFSRIVKKHAEAQEKFQVEINKLVENREKVQQRLNELQRAKKGENQRFILSPEQKKEIKQYQQEMAETNQDLKKLRKELRREVDRLQFTLKAVNIAGMPFLVIICGMGLFVYNRVRSKRSRSQ